MKTLAITTTICMCAGAARAAPPTYSVEFLGPATHLEAVNDAGQCVGWRSSGGIRAWLGMPGEGVVDLPLPEGFTSSQAEDINNAGVIVGSVAEGGFPEFGKAARWTPDGEGGYDIDLLGALPGHTQSIATAINDQGDVVGFSIVPGFGGGPGVWFNSPSGVMDLTAEGLASTAADINAERQVISQRTILDLDTMELETLPVPVIDGWPDFTGLVFTNAISDEGVVVGHAILACCTNNNQVNVRHTPELGWEALFPFGTKFGSAYGVNDKGTVVMDNGGSEVFAWFPGEGHFDLDSLLAPGSQGWLMVTNFGDDINELGQIAAIATNPETNQTGAVLLTDESFCPADFNADGAVNVLDFVAFQAAFNAEDPAADCDADGALSVLDFLCFQGAFQAGCP